MTAMLDDPSFGHDADEVGVSDRAQAVSDQDQGLGVTQVFDRALYDGFGL